MAEESEFDSWQRQEVLLFSIRSISALLSFLLPVFYKMDTKNFFLGGKAAET
jgi:hypothetical protein